MSATFVFAVLNSLWQGCALAAIVALVVRLIPRANAATTCAIWTATYALIAVLPIIDLVAARSVSEPTVAVHRTIVRAPRIAPQREATKPIALHILEQQAPASVSYVRTASALADHVAMPLLLAWMAIAAGLLIRLSTGFVHAHALKRNAEPFTIDDASLNLATGRRTRIGTSLDVRVPCAVGFVHPMIVVPRALAESLAPGDLARVVLHEHAHLRRYDDWQNALQRLIGAVFFFHPALYFVGRRIDFDREVAADDRVLDAVGKPIEYAECLTKIVERHVRGTRVAVVPGFFIGRSQVVERVKRLIDYRRNVSPRITRSGALAAVAAVAIALLLVRLQIPVIAAAIVPDDRTAHRAIAAVDRPLDVVQIPIVERTELRAPRALTTVPSIPVPHLVANLNLPAQAIHVDVDQTQAKRAPSKSNESTTSISLLDAIDHAGYPHVSVEELVELNNHGVTGRFLASMATKLSEKPTIAQLIVLADHGASPEFVAGMARAGYSHLNADRVVDLVDHGVSPTFVKRLTDHGYRNLSIDQLIELSDSGIRE